MKLKPFHIVFICFGLFCVSYLNASSTGLEFLNIMPGARPAGLGDAFTSMSDDLNAVYSNPAGLGFISHPEFQASYSLWLADTYLASAGYLYPFSSGAFAVHGLYLGGTPITRFEDGALKDTFSPADTAAGISFGYKLSNTFALGLTAKSAQETLDTDYSANVLCGDAGFLYRSENEVFSFGYDARNLGPSTFAYSNSTVNDKLPITQSVGIRIKLDLPEQSSLINFTLQSDMPASGQPSYSAGIEHWGANTLALRVGYKYLTDDKTVQALDSLSGLRAGIGINVKGIGIDYAYEPFATLGETHRVSLVMKFADREETPKTFDVSLKVDPSIFSPNNDGIKDSTFFLPEVPQLNKIKSWAIHIYDAYNIPVKTITTAGAAEITDNTGNTPALPKIINWDGKTDLNAFAPEGNYEAELVINADGKTGKSFRQPLQIDLTPPQATFTASTGTISPNGDNISGATTFFFILTDANPLDRWQMTITSSKNKIVKTFKSPEESIGATYLKKDINWVGRDDVYGEVVPNGDYKAQLVVFDMAGNKAQAELTISVKVAPKEIIKHEFQGLKISLSSEVLFDRNKASLKPEAYGALDKAFDTIQTYPENKIIIEGHTDISEAKFATELSSPRAWNVYSYLVKKGVKPERMSVKGWGASKPISPNTTRAGRMKNRRVEITISKERLAPKQNPQTPAQQQQGQQAPAQTPQTQPAQ